MTAPLKPLPSAREISLPETIVFKTKRSYILAADGIWVEPKNLLQPGWLRIESGRIAAAGSGRPLLSADADLLDLGPVLVTPGLIDAHVHLDLDPGHGLDLAGRVSLAAAYGLAAVRDGGDKKALVLSSRNLIQRKMLLAASGQALYFPGRYGAFLGRPVAGRREMARAVRETAQRGADQIKVLASGPVDLDKFGMVGSPQFSAEDLRHLVTLAQNEGLGVMAHANGAEAVTMCLRAGVDSIEHGYFMGPEALKLLAGSGTAWIPTILPLAALAEREPEGSPRQAMIRRIMARQVEQLAQAGDMSVKLVLGTDAGSPGVAAGPGLGQEMAWWLRAGLGAEDVLAAATVRGADLLGRTKDVGRLRPGNMAFVVCFPKTASLAEALVQGPELVGRPDLQ